ncbi:hypothetical protein NQ318_000109 [Aromia moschata]|uniref:Ribosomal protein S4 n=1 Tax=Aromia moschata TaxID=1265417 RepID=A0AAV8XGD6_9CUCU|nr:hypothetical protein NQ318_000109 [Aromia moschata]
MHKHITKRIHRLGLVNRKQENPGYVVFEEDIIENYLYCCAHYPEDQKLNDQFTRKPRNILIPTSARRKIRRDSFDYPRNVLEVGQLISSGENLNSLARGSSRAVSGTGARK